MTTTSKGCCEASVGIPGVVKPLWLVRVVVKPLWLVEGVVKSLWLLGGLVNPL